MVRIYGISTISGEGSGSTLLEFQYQMHGVSEGNDTITLSKDGNPTQTVNNALIVKENTAVLLRFNVVAETVSTKKLGAAWVFEGLAKRESLASSVKFLGALSVNSISDDEIKGFQIQLSENISLGSISIICKGLAGYTDINWKAIVSVTEV